MSKINTSVCFRVHNYDHTLGAEVVPNFEYIVNELPQRPKGKAA